MIIINLDTNEVWDFGRTKKNSDIDWHAADVRKYSLSGDGVTPQMTATPKQWTGDYTLNNCIENIRSCPTWLGENSCYDFLSATRASNTPLLHGIITFDDIKYNREINHALALGTDFYLNCHMSISPMRGWGKYPAIKHNEGSSLNESNCLELGDRIRLDPSIDVTNQGWSPGVVQIAKALQDYGMIFAIQSGGDHSLVAENRAGKEEQWSSIGGIPRLNEITYDIGTAVGWNAFIVLENPLKPPFNQFECADGIDNDDDSLIDFPNDPQCESPYDDDDEGNLLTDINFDGKTDITDVRVCMNVIARIGTNPLADVNGDSIVDLNDVKEIVKNISY